VEHTDATLPADGRLLRQDHSLTTAAGIVQRRLIVNYEVRSDGTFTELVQSVMVPKDAATAQQLRAVPIKFSSPAETVELEEAVVEKADGRRLAVNVMQILPEAATGGSQLPLFNVLQQKVIKFPLVVVGDEIAIRYRRRCLRPLISDAFVMHRALANAFRWSDVQISLRAPLTMNLHVSSWGVREARRVEGMEEYMEWRYDSQVAASSDEVSSPGRPDDNIATVSVTSINGCDDFAQRLLALWDSEKFTTSAVQDIAKQIVRDVTGEEQLVKTCVQWMNTNIRPVALPLGCRPVIPHAPALVIANGYGDGIDRAVALAALLRAVSVETEFALVPSSTSYSLHETPRLQHFSHVALWVPTLRAYIDLTVDGSPAAEPTNGAGGYGRLHLPRKGNRASLTPAVAAKPILVTTEQEITSVGALMGCTSLSGYGEMGNLVRTASRIILGAGGASAAGTQFGYFGLTGSGDIQIQRDDADEDICTATSRFLSSAIPGMFIGTPFPLFCGLSPLGRSIESILRLLLMDLNGVQGASDLWGNGLIERIELRLPLGAIMKGLPPPVERSGQAVTYESIWTQTGQQLEVNRVIRVAAVKGADTLGLIREVTDALDAMRDEYRTKISLCGLLGPVA
jgi:hypothetical protein